MMNETLAGIRRTTRRIRKRRQERSSYYVYMLLCDDGSYYTGYTSSVASRFERHEKGQGARYTKMRKPTRIVYVQRFKTRRAAMRKEREIKALSHDQKHDLTIKVRSVGLETIGPGYRRNGPFRVT
jgi:putative endonuclease